MVQALESTVEASAIKLWKIPLPSSTLCVFTFTTIWYCLNKLLRATGSNLSLLLMLHLQEPIYSADVATQILYNRTSGSAWNLCIQVCVNQGGSSIILQEIFATQRMKEWLCSGCSPTTLSSPYFAPSKRKLRKSNECCPSICVLTRKNRNGRRFVNRSENC